MSSLLGVELPAGVAADVAGGLEAGLEANSASLIAVDCDLMVATSASFALLEENPGEGGAVDALLFCDGSGVYCVGRRVNSEACFCSETSAGGVY